MKQPIPSKHPRNHTFFGKDYHARQGARLFNAREAGCEISALFRGSERQVRLFINNGLWVKPLNYYQIFARKKDLSFHRYYCFSLNENLGNIFQSLSALSLRRTGKQ